MTRLASSILSKSNFSLSGASTRTRQRGSNSNPSTSVPPTTEGAQASFMCSSVRVCSGVGSAQSGLSGSTLNVTPERDLLVAKEPVTSSPAGGSGHDFSET